MDGNYGYPLRPHARDCDYYMKNGTCEMDCMYNHPVRRPKQVVEKKKEKEVLAAQTSNSAYRRPRLPKFGSWENEEGVPYTMCFENVRNGRTGEEMIKPNAPKEILKAPSLRTREPIGEPASGLVHNHRVGREEKEPRQFSESLSNYNARSIGAESSRGAYMANVLVSNEIRKGSTMPSTASENKYNRQPPDHEQANGPWSDVSPPYSSREAKNLYETSQGTPGGSQIHLSIQVDYSPGRGAAIPEFGHWNNDSPEPGDDYTAIFHKPNGRKQSGEHIRPGMEFKGTVSPSNDIKQNDIKPKQYPKKKTKVRCFRLRWFKK